jgi:hypothetical protein
MKLNKQGRVEKRLSHVAHNHKIVGSTPTPAPISNVEIKTEGMGE